MEPRQPSPPPGPPAPADTVAAGATVAAGPPPADAEMLRPGAAVGRYVVLEVVGSGGMGVVYAAYDPKLDRKVALKLLRPGGGDPVATAAADARLLREAQAMARLSHPNVITVHDVGTYQDQVFVAMEFVDGWTLREWLQEARPQWREVLDKYRRAGAGIVAAHRAGLVHRDFKPNNVLLGRDGRVRVVDFGLARADEAVRVATPEEALDRTETMASAALATPLTRTGAVMGTPAYMAPEAGRRVQSGHRNAHEPGGPVGTIRT